MTVSVVVVVLAGEVSGQERLIHLADGIAVDQTLTKPLLPSIGTITPDPSGLNTTLTLKSDPARPGFDGIPKWNLAFHAQRQVSGHLRLGAMVSATRGENGPALLSQELATGRDVSVNTPLTGPGTYETVFNTAFTLTVPLKESGHVNLKVVGEVWNPFSPTRTSSAPGDPLLNGRAVRIGLLTTF